jgi:hypothetical protein
MCCSAPTITPNSPLTFQNLEVTLILNRLDKENAGRVLGLSSASAPVGINRRHWLIHHHRSPDHITDGLTSLYQLRFSAHIQYKIAWLTFKMLHRSPRDTDLTCRQALRSAGTTGLLVLPVKLSAVSSRAFPVTGSQVWNDPPDEFSSLHHCRFSTGVSRPVSVSEILSDSFYSLLVADLVV